MTYLRVALVVAAALLCTRSAAAECPKPRGKPIYRVTREPLHKPPKGDPTPVERQTFSVFATGRWVGTDEGSGCLGPQTMRELTLALARARFDVVSRGNVVTCQAVPTMRVKYAALRRGKRITTEEPCGIPLDPTTARLARCAEAATSESPPPIEELRRICRGKD